MHNKKSDQLSVYEALVIHGKQLKDNPELKAGLDTQLKQLIHANRSLIEAHCKLALINDAQQTKIPTVQKIHKALDSIIKANLTLNEALIKTLKTGKTVSHEEKQDASHKPPKPGR